MYMASTLQPTSVKISYIFMFRSMDLPPKLESKLSVRYITDEAEKERRKKKRKEMFIGQVRKAVVKMQVPNLKGEQI